MIMTRSGNEMSLNVLGFIFFHSLNIGQTLASESKCLNYAVLISFTCFFSI